MGKRYDRARALLVVFTAVLLLAAFAQILASQERQARDDLVRRFRVRGQTGVQLISSYIRDVGGREATFAAKRLSDPQPSREAFEAMVDSFGFEAAVLLDAEGNLTHVYPHREDILGQNLAGRYAHLSRALSGQTAVSDVVPSAAKNLPVVAVAVPYETPHGRRVVSGAFAIGSSPLDEFLANILPYRANVYLIDSSSMIMASTASVSEVFTPLGRQDPALYRSLRFEGADTYVRGGDKHVVSLQAVPNTSWSLVMSAPQARVLGPLLGFQWVPWLVYAGLVAASAAASVLLIRLWQRERELREERGKLHQQLQEEYRLNKALDEFAGRVAHDLRSPLGNALTATQMAVRQKHDDKMVEKWLTMAQGQVRRGIDLIQGLLDLAKAAGTPKKEQVDLSALVEELAHEIDGIQVQADQLPSIDADKLAIRQALANLMENAARYARTNGVAEVAVKAEMQGSECTITVEDQGPGLSPEEATSLFRPFQRGSAQSTPGTGLGLAIVATAASAHGGRAWYEPRAGGGSAFKILIPGSTESPSPSDPSARGKTAPTGGQDGPSLS